MIVIQRQHLVEATERKVAVQIDFETFERLEESLESYALAHVFGFSEGEVPLSQEEAKAYYQYFEKAS